MDRSTRLALAARDGDDAAAADLVRLTQADVWRWCAHLGDRDRADDLTQETYLRAWRSLPGFRADSSVLTWLYQIARRVVSDDIAAHQRRRAGVTSQWGLAARESQTDHAGELALSSLVRLLDPDRREAFVLTQLLGYSYAEAADLVACPLGTIRSRVARARADLMGWLEESSSTDRRSG